MQHLANSPLPAPSPPHIPTTLENEDAPHFAKLESFNQGLLEQIQNLTDIMAQHSQALRTLTMMHAKLSAIVVCIKCMIDTIIPAPTPHQSAPVPMLHPMAMTETKIPLTPAPAPEKQQLSFPPHQYRNNLHWPTDATPWPPPLPALFPKPAQTLKPPTRIKKILVKSSVIHGCPGMLRTKDNLHPP